MAGTSKEELTVNQVQQEISRAFNILRQISVKDGDVEKMAMAKGALANAHKLAAGEEPAEQARKEGTRDGK